MQRNSKQVLLKYCTLERKATEDDVLMYKIKNLLRWFFLTALLFFPFMFYASLYFGDVLYETSEVYGWGRNISRSIPLYVIPDKDTALIVGRNICSEPVLLLVIVFSAVKNTLERATIRETWGNFSSPDYQLAFFLGTTENVTLQEEIEEEASVHNDIIQENFIDTYNNLTLKAVMVLKFVKTRCQQAKYIYKADDDTFVYIPNLLRIVKMAEKKNLKDVLIGNLICGSVPILNPSNKWYTPKYMFNEKVYPNYLSGTGYLMDKNTAGKLYEAALEIPFINMEDVFITGLCARKVKIRPRNHNGFTFARRPHNPCIYLTNPNVVSSHTVPLEDMRELWTLLNSRVQCPKSKVNKPMGIEFEFLKVHVGKRKRCF